MDDRTVHEPLACSFGLMVAFGVVVESRQRIRQSCLGASRRVLEVKRYALPRAGQVSGLGDVIA